MALYGGTAASVRINGAAIAKLLESEDGPIMRNMADRATRVQDGAKRQVGVSEIPREDSHLRDTIVKRFARDSKGPMVLVGSAHPRALMHHNGTKAHPIDPIDPVNGPKVLAFPVAGGMVFTPHVDHPGTKPNRYLTDNLKLAR